MRKTILPILLLITFSNCTDNKEKKNDDTLAQEESDVLRDYEIQQKVDSTMKAIKHDAMFDTAGLSNAPVIVKSARLVDREYSSYRDISLTFKNVSGKKIEAVRFRWYGENAFGEPADMGTSLTEGFGGGFDDDPLSPGKSRTSSWSILSNNGRKVVLAWPTEVAFSDGTKWEIGTSTATPSTDTLSFQNLDN